MELIIYSPQETGFVHKIDWNFDELKTEITAAARDYETSVYTDDTIRNAKADRAKLNKFVDALKTKRTDVRKKLLEPDELFGRQVNELSDIVQSAITNIDSQVKDFERRQRDEKTAKVKEFYGENINDLEEYLPFERIFKPEYANAATTMKSIKEEILSLIQTVSEGLAVLNEVDSPYAGEMKEVFLRTYNIADAMAERNRLEAAEQKRQEYAAEQARKKAERDAQVKADASRVMNAGQVNAPKPEELKPEPSVSAPQVDIVEEPVHLIDFRVRATKGQLDKLKLFLVENRIQFGPVPKEEN